MDRMMESAHAEHWKRGLEELNVHLTSEQNNQFMQYYEMLVEKNKVMNLTGITEFREVMDKHFLDSISLIRQVKELDQEEVAIMDLGTGAGFPGIPLKITFPKIRIVLADSLNKRILFLQEVIDALALTNVEAVHGRAEELARKPEYREQFDYCVSRAVANLSSLSEYCLPFVKKGGAFISYKSGDILEEADNAKKAWKILGGELKEIDHFLVPDTDLNRSFVVVEKKSATPKKYPRKAGTPTKEPL